MPTPPVLSDAWWAELAGRRVLAVVAHPDDVDFLGGATVARLVAAGASVSYVLATRGERGGQDAGVAPEDLGRVRETEQRAAADVLGVASISFLDRQDTQVVDDVDLHRDVARAFRRAQPHVLLTLDPRQLPPVAAGTVRRRPNHPDHRAVGRCALDVVMTAGSTAMVLPELSTVEGLPPWEGLEAVLLLAGGTGGEPVDVSDYLPQKAAALRCHASQVVGLDVGAYVARRAAEAGAPHGLAAAETFEVLDTRR